MGLIYLDTCLVIYLVERHPAWFETVTTEIAARSDARFAISPLVKAECLVAPLRRGDVASEHAYTGFFESLVTLEIGEAIFLHAASLRARFGLKMPDALHLACAQRHRCDELWTNDTRMGQAGGSLARALLSPNDG